MVSLELILSLNKSTLKKLVVLKAKTQNSWHSLNVIEENIAQAFSRSHLPVEFFETDTILTIDQIKKLKQLVCDSSVFLFFLSDKIDHCQVVQQCLDIGSLTYLIPVYGNMTIETERWEQLNKILDGEKVILLAASERSTEQIKILTHSSTTINTLPYPIEVKCPLTPMIKDDVIRIVYAGRITTGKNILQLLEVFSKAVGFKTNLELHIAGDFHDRGHQFHGYGVPYQQLKNSFYTYIDESDSKIFYHDQLSQEDLYKLYSRMDIFCSPSTYHDEDFGVSAAQAGLMGLDLMLSDWGGHASFPKAKLIPVSVDDLNIPQIDKEALFKIFLKVVKTPLKIDNPLLRDYLSYKTFIRSMTDILETPVCAYKGASAVYNEFGQAMKKAPPFFSETPGSRKLYLDIYQSYLRQVSAYGST
jgi:glycosyltransferase involved in cell wall biosynthesis